MSDDNNTQKNVSREFIDNVKKYLEMDDNIAELKTKLKNLTAEKNIYEEKILNYMTEMDETIIDTNNGKLKKSVTKTKGGIKKNYIVDTLSTTFDDAIKVQLLTDKIMDSIPSKEKITLTRTKK